MTRLKEFEKNYEGSISEKFNTWMEENPAFTVTHITSNDSSSQHGSRSKTLYVVYETNEEVKL